MKKGIDEGTEEFKNDQATESPGFIDVNVARTSSACAVNQLCDSLGLSPAITSNRVKQNKDRLALIANDKLAKVNQAVASHLSTSFGVHVEPSSNSCQNCDGLIERLLEKFTESQSFLERKKLLTVVPDSYTIEETMRKFNCSKYLVVESRKLKETLGIMPELSKRKSGKEISPEVKALVVEFYEENARMCPGAREYVTITDPNGEKIKKQKMLLLDTIEELHGVFSSEHPSVKVGEFI